MAVCSIFTFFESTLDQPLTMKKHYLLLSLLFATLALQAQTSIQVDTTLNWQQWIPSLLGGNCVNISNVSYNSTPGTASRFSNAGVIGLNEGIVISTGYLSEEVGFNPITNLNSTTNMNSSDTLLETYAINSMGYTGGASSYDATRLEFDFTASISGDVSIRFVFASEEYPMYAPPNTNFYNDIFGFFVAPAGSSNYQNIAVLPGTSTPVSIGNVNAVTNVQYYLEAAEMDSFAFNGFTVPLTATFTVSAGQTYHLIMAISDIGDSVFDSAVFLEKTQNTVQSLQGTALAGAGPMNAGYMELFGYSIAEGAFPRVDSTGLNSDGTWSFQNVEEGGYLIRCMPDQTVFQNSVPTYFNGEVLWEQAQIVSASCDVTDASPAVLTIMTGPGGIAGQITQELTGGRLRSGSPAEGVHVFLQDSASGAWRGFDVTDAEGLFEFTNLAFGTYYVLPDEPGLHLDLIKKVVLSEDQTLVNDLVFVKTGTVITEPIITGVCGVPDANWMVYPNPGADQLKIKGFMAQYANVEIRDLRGALILQQTVEGTAAWNTSDWNPGVYFVKICSSDGKVQVMRWMKQD
jgi:hypothetical protein